MQSGKPSTGLFVDASLIGQDEAPTDLFVKISGVAETPKKKKAEFKEHGIDEVLMEISIDSVSREGEAHSTGATGEKVAEVKGADADKNIPEETDQKMLAATESPSRGVEGSPPPIAGKVSSPNLEKLVQNPGTSQPVKKAASSIPGGAKEKLGNKYQKALKSIMAVREVAEIFGPRLDIMEEAMYDALDSHTNSDKEYNARISELEEENTQISEDLGKMRSAESLRVKAMREIQEALSRSEDEKKEALSKLTVLAEESARDLQEDKRRHDAKLDEARRAFEEEKGQLKAKITVKEKEHVADSFLALAQSKLIGEYINIYWRACVDVKKVELEKVDVFAELENLKVLTPHLRILEARVDKCLKELEKGGSSSSSASTEEKILRLQADKVKEMARLEQHYKDVVDNVRKSLLTDEFEYGVKAGALKGK